MKVTELHTTGEVQAAIAKVNRNRDYAVLDLETTSKDPRKAKVIDIQMSGIEPEEVYIFPGKFLIELQALEVRQVWQNYKYDYTVAYCNGIDLRGKPLHDTMLMHHLLNETASHSLESMIGEFFEGSKEEYKTDFWKKYSAYTEAPRHEQIDYACSDILWTDRVYNTLRDRLLSDGIPSLLVDHTHKLARCLLDTEFAGLKVDLDYTTELGIELKTSIADLEKTMHATCENEVKLIELQLWKKQIEKFKTPKKRQSVECPEFNWGSSQQRNILLYEQLGLPEQYKWSYSKKVGKKVKVVTSDKDAIIALTGKHPVIEHMTQYNAYKVYNSTFIEGILERVEEERVYPSFNINGTVTGRISHSNPNMGNMPSRGSWAKIRNIFVADDGELICKSDYSQLEICIAAHYSQDKNLLKIVHEGASQHDITNEELKLNNRDDAKTVNFAMQYLCQPGKIASILGISKKDAQYVYDKYWETYAGQKKLIDECAAKVDKGEPIISLFGRQRRFEVRKRHPMDKAYRQAYNALIQGTGGDITSMAFYMASDAVTDAGIGRGGWTIHDELIMFAKEEHNDKVLDILTQTMVCCGEEVKLTVPLRVEGEGGLRRWKK